MRILILADSYLTKCFGDVFAIDPNNIIFSLSKCFNKIEAYCDSDIVEFADANEINFVLIADEKYIKDDLIEKLNNLNCSVFSPAQGAIEIISSRASAKKFMYKNKIQTPEFQIFEKAGAALDYVKRNTRPCAIKPEYRSFRERTIFSETKSQSFRAIEGFFAKANPKIVIEDYIEGKNITSYVLSDGYSAKLLGTCAKYSDSVSYFEPEFVCDDLKKSITDFFITPTIRALSSSGNEYIGILGFDFILDRRGNLNLVGYKSFFDDIDCAFFTKGFDINWLDVFNATIRGDVFLNYEIEPQKNEYMIALRQDNCGIEEFEARTFGNLELYVEESGFDTKEFKEAVKIWRA